MKKTRFYFLMMFGLFFLTNVQGSLIFSEKENNHDNGRWSFSIEPMVTRVFGNDEHIGDRYQFYQTLLNNSEGRILEYGIDYRPIVLYMPHKVNVSLDLSYQKSEWRIGLRAWQFNASANKSGIVTTPAILINEDGSITTFISGVGMFDNMIRPLINIEEASAKSPVSYWGNNDLNIWTSELYVDRRLASNFGFIFGIKAVNIKNQQSIGQKQHVLAYQDFFQSLLLENYITLSQNSKVNYLVVGPGVGFNFQTKHIKGFIKQAILFGKAKYSGQWHDVDDITITWTDTGSLYQKWYYDGKFPFKRETWESIPNTEFSIKFYDEVSVNKNISFDFGLGIFVSTFWNAPVAPQWSIPGEWTWAEGSNWHTQTKNLTFAGLTASFEAKF